MKYIANNVLSKTSTTSDGGKQNRISGTRMNGSELNWTELNWSEHNETDKLKKFKDLQDRCQQDDEIGHKNCGGCNYSIRKS